MKSFLRKNRSFLLALGVLFIVRGSFADHNVVPTGSMEPTIHVGDHILVDKTAYDIHLPFSEVRVLSLREPRRGDIIVFFSPVDGKRLVKRLIGIPGDHLKIENGFVSINGRVTPGSDNGAKTLQRSPENEINYQEEIGAHRATIRRTRSLFRPESMDLTIPSDNYFAMGDNRDNSYDSRSWGFVPRQNIEGRAVGVLFNLAWTPLPKPDFHRLAKKFD